MNAFNATREACRDVRAYQRKRTWDRSLFVVMRDFGKIGMESVTNPEMTRESLIADIASGQIDRVVLVTELNPVEGWASDITSDVLDAAEAIVSARIAAE
jgi:hypothetical protein